MAVTAPGSDLWVLSTPESARADAKSVTSISKSVTHGRPHDSDDTLGASFSPALTLMWRGRQRRTSVGGVQVRGVLSKGASSFRSRFARAFGLKTEDSCVDRRTETHVTYSLGKGTHAKPPEHDYPLNVGKVWYHHDTFASEKSPTFALDGRERLAAPRRCHSRMRCLTAQLWPGGAEAH